MKIKYLTLYNEKKDEFVRVKNNEKLKVEPCTIEEIESLEEQVNGGEPLPQALREYLFIGGHYNSLSIDSAYQGMKKSTDYVKIKLKERGIEMDKPFVIFSHFEGQIFSFIYLDEGDNPQPWNCSINKAYDSDDNEIVWKIPFKTFKDFIDMLTDLALKGMVL